MVRRGRRNSLGRASWPSWLLFIEAKLPWGMRRLNSSMRSWRRVLCAAPRTNVLAWILAASSHQPGGGALRHRCTAISARQS